MTNAELESLKGILENSISMLSSKWEGGVYLNLLFWILVLPLFVIGVWLIIFAIKRIVDKKLKGIALLCTAILFIIIAIIAGIVIINFLGKMSGDWKNQAKIMEHINMLKEIIAMINEKLAIK